MIRLGIKLSLSGGRESITRLVVIALSVIVGVTILLVAASGFHAIEAQGNRPCWACTVTTNQQPSVNPSSTDPLLWLYQDDYVKGSELKRLEVAALGPKAPILPGIRRLPKTGEYYASPALIKLERAMPKDELANRFPGRLVGTIGEAALSDPNELVAFVGRPPSALRQDPLTITVRSIETAAEPVSYTTFLKLIYIVGAIGLLFPMIILISTATRLSASRREQRFAAMRLVGTTSGQVSLLASVDALIGSIIGTVCGIGVFVIARPCIARATVGSARLFIKDFTPTPTAYVLVIVGVPILAVVGALFSLRRVNISPLGVSRRATPKSPRARRLLPLIVGAATLLTIVATTHRQNVGSDVLLPASVGFVLVMIGLMIAGPWLTAVVLRLFGSRTSSAAGLLASRRLADNPRAAFRAVSGLVLAVFVGSLFSTLAPAFESGSSSAQSGRLANTLTVMFFDSETAGLSPSQGVLLMGQLNGIGHLRLIPIYAIQDAPTTNRNGTLGLLGCHDLQTLSALGRCPRGATELQIRTTPLVKNHSTDILAGTPSSTSPATLATRPLQALLVTSSDGAAPIERARTLIAIRPGVTQVPETFGEARLSTLRSVDTLQRLVDVAIGITLLVAGCSLAIAVAGGLVERRRPFGLLRVAGLPLSVLDKVVLLESAAPLVAVAAISAIAGFGVAASLIVAVASHGTVVKLPGDAFYLTIGIGLVTALFIVGATLPLLNRMTQPENARFE